VFLLFAALTLFFSVGTATAQFNKTVQISERGQRPNLGFDYSGMLHLVWEDTLQQIKYMVVDTLGNTVRPAMQLPYGPYPYVAFARDFGLLSYCRYSGFNSEIYGRLISSNDPPAAEQFLINDPFYDAIRYTSESKRVDDTLLLVLWNGQGPRSSLGAIYGHMVGRSGRLKGEDLFLCDTVLDGQRLLTPKAAVSCDLESIWITWLDDGEATKSIFYRRLTHLGMTAGDVTTLAGPTLSDTLWSPSIAVRGDNRILVSWSEKRAGVWGVYVQQLDENGAKKDSVVTLNSDSVAAYAETRLASSESGTVFAVWEGVKNGHLALFGANLDRLGSSQPRPVMMFPLEDSLDQIWPAVAVHGAKVFLCCKRGEGIVLRILDILLTSADTEKPRPIQPSTDERINPFAFLEQNYPNPFNWATTIRYTVQTHSHIRLAVFDILGREVSLLENAHKPPGSYTVRWDAVDLPTGIYICRIVLTREARTLSQSRLMIMCR
jgi:hypothetical protein